MNQEHINNSNGEQISLPSIRQYKSKHIRSEHSFYIQCKGLNSGKPLHEPIPNSFEIRCKDAGHRINMYWLCNALWQSKTLSPYLRGSVIPFITLHDYRKVIQETCLRVTFEKDAISKLIANLEIINQLEELTKTKLKLIKALKVAMIRGLLE